MYVIAVWLFQSKIATRLLNIYQFQQKQQKLVQFVHTFTNCLHIVSIISVEGYYYLAMPSPFFQHLLLLLHTFFFLFFWSVSQLDVITKQSSWFIANIYIFYYEYFILYHFNSTSENEFPFGNVSKTLANVFKPNFVAS